MRDDFDTTEGRAELRLSRALARLPTPGRVQRALDECRPKRETTDPRACQYVTRSVLRNLGAFDAAGTLSDTRARFRGATRTYDRAVLSARSQGDWYEAAAQYLLSDAHTAVPREGAP